MPNEFLISNLITATREAGMLPQQTDSTDDARVLATLNREQKTSLAAFMRKLREEYASATADITLVEGTLRYRIPTRAMGAAFKAARLVADDDSERDLVQLPEKERVGGVGDYYLEGNYTVFRTQPSATTLRIGYARRLGKLVTSAEADTVTAINTSTGVLTTERADESGTTQPSGWGTGDRYDLVRATPHFDVLAADLTASDVSDGSITFAAADLPDELAAGDFICLAGESPVVQAPLELHELLMQYALKKLLVGRKDKVALDAVKEEITKLEADCLDIMAPRVEGDDHVIQNYNAPGWSNAARLFGGNRRY